MTYEELKKANDMKVKDWFNCDVSYPFSPDYDWRTAFDIVKETEKAVCITIGIHSCNGEWEGSRNVWVPKSCFESCEEYEAKARRAEIIAKEATERYERLVDFCKENKVKGARFGLRKETLLRKIEEAGLTYNY